MVTVLPDLDVSHLDQVLLDDRGQLRVVDSSVYEGIDPIELRVWCHKRAFYGLPTTELIAYLKTIIGGRSCIEVGSGNGALGRALGVPMTDNFCQRRPDVALLYTLQGQPLIDYGADVEQLEAKQAVKKYRPRVVVGSWVTQWSDGSRPGCMFGIDEDWMLRRVKTYVIFGSLRNHSPQFKAIRAHPHRVVQEPWMWSRAPDSALFVWDT
jgi:hypothetical protein